MTTRNEDEIRRRKAPRLVEVNRSPFLALAEACREMANASETIVWPNVRYEKEPVAFFTEILGVEPWEKQVEVIEAVRDYDRVTVAAAHKVSKSHSAAGLALWWFRRALHLLASRRGGVGCGSSNDDVFRASAPPSTSEAIDSAGASSAPHPIDQPPTANAIVDATTTRMRAS